MREKLSDGALLKSMEKDASHWIQSSIVALSESKKGNKFDEVAASAQAEVIDLNSEDNKVSTDKDLRTSLSAAIEGLCIKWVNRPAIPSQKMQDFLGEHQGLNGLPEFISTTTFKRALQLLGKAGRIKKSDSNRWELP